MKLPSLGINIPNVLCTVNSDMYQDGVHNSTLACADHQMCYPWSNVDETKSKCCYSEPCLKQPSESESGLFQQMYYNTGIIQHQCILTAASVFNNICIKIISALKYLFSFYKMRAAQDQCYCRCRIQHCGYAFKSCNESQNSLIIRIRISVKALTRIGTYVLRIYSVSVLQGCRCQDAALVTM